MQHGRAESQAPTLVRLPALAAGFSPDASIKTVESRCGLPLRKLTLDTTADLIRYAIRNELVEA